MDVFVNSNYSYSTMFKIKKLPFAFTNKISFLKNLLLSNRKYDQDDRCCIIKYNKYSLEIACQKGYFECCIGLRFIRR